MLNIFNRIPNLGVAIAEYLTAENKDSISVITSLATAINNAITNGENPLTMDLMMLEFLIKIPANGENLTEIIASGLNRRKTIMGNNCQLSDELIGNMYRLTYDMNNNHEIIATRYANILEQAKEAPDCVRNSVMRTIMNSIVLTGKYALPEYREILIEAIPYAKEIQSESDVNFEGARCNFWNL